MESAKRGAAMKKEADVVPPVKQGSQPKSTTYQARLF